MVSLKIIINIYFLQFYLIIKCLWSHKFGKKKQPPLFVVSCYNLYFSHKILIFLLCFYICRMHLTLLRIWHIWGEQEHQLGLFTEYTPFKSKKELFLANSEYKQNVINILRKILVEEGCSTMQASGIMQMS
jgi:hypothetical protein